MLFFTSKERKILAASVIMGFKVKSQFLESVLLKVVSGLLSNLTLMSCTSSQHFLPCLIPGDCITGTMEF